MKIDFGGMSDVKISGMNGGTGEMTARMYEGDGMKVMPCRIHPGGSIGAHRHEDGDDISYILYGTGIAVCDGVEETLTTDVCHICPRGSEHSIVNTGMTDLVMLNVLVRR